MSRLKISAAFGVIFTLFTAITFYIDFYWFQGMMPGYKVVAYPGILVLRIFSEELGFIYKLSILLSSQFIFYTLLFYVVFKARNAIKLKAASSLREG